jgi:hypothetical protein
MRQLPTRHRALFATCTARADDSVALARCFVPVFQARDSPPAMGDQETRVNFKIKEFYSENF